MKELKDHLQEICRMIEEENSHFLSFLERIKQRSDRLSHFSHTFQPRVEGELWEKGKRP